MTGNTKVWRAPLAGLAAVAMLATMGVATSTANAADEFTVKFDANGHGEAPSSLTVKETDGYKVGADWSSKSAPKADGWTFTGWYTAANLGEGERFDTQAPVLEDTTLYAHWAKRADVTEVKFSSTATLTYPDLNQDGTPNNSGDRQFLVAKGDKLSAWNTPVDKTADHKKLTGFTDKDGKADFDFTQAVSGKTLTAYATVATATNVTFDASTAAYGLSGETSKTKTVEVANGDNVELPTAVDGTNGDAHVVNQWYVDKAADRLDQNNKPHFNQGNKGKLWEGGAAVKSDGSYYKDLTLVPADDATKANDWEQAKAHKITFHYKANPTSETVPNAIWATEGEPVSLPAPDTHGDKLVFDGWYTDNALTTRFYDGDVMPEGDNVVSFDLYGALSVGNVQFTVTFDPDYTGSTPTEVKTAKGATVAKPEAPTRDGYVFAGWALDGDKDLDTDHDGKLDHIALAYRTDADFRTVQVNADLTFKALWLTASQSELKGLLDETGAAYDQNTQAWTDFQNKQTDVKNKAAYYQDIASSVKALSHVSEAAAKDYIKQLSDLKGKLTATNGQFIDVFTGNNGTVATPHSTDINFVAKKGISTGYGDGTFKPTGSMFRQDYAAFLYRLAGSPEYTPAASDNIFTDVTPATPHYKEILWAAKQGIIKGFADGTFRGLALVNRQDAAAFLYRAAGSPEFDASKAAKTFTDVNESTPHYKEVLWAANTVVNQDYDGDGTTDNETAIIQGFNTGTFDGYATLLRQDGAAFLARTYFYINK